jgi:hypothetical protein
MKRAELFILDLILPQLIDMDFCDLYPLADPLAILQDILNAPVESRYHFTTVFPMVSIYNQIVFLIKIICKIIFQSIACIGHRNSRGGLHCRHL